MAAVFVVIIIPNSLSAAFAQSIDLDSTAMEAGGRMLDRYLAEHSLQTDSVRFSSLAEVRLPRRLLTAKASSRLITIYELHSELVRQDGALDSLHTVVTGVYVPQLGSTAEKIYIESTEGIEISRGVNLARSRFVTVRETIPPSFWRSVAEPALVIIGAAAIVALFFLIRS